MTCIRHSKLQCADCGRPQTPLTPPTVSPQQIHFQEGRPMPAHQNIRVPNKGYAAAIAGEHLYRMGPLLAHQLFAAVEFGTDKTTKEAALQRAVTSGWLTEQADGRINLSPVARAHYDRLAGLETVEYVGQIAAVREPVSFIDRPPLRKAYMPNSRGNRPDIPAWSVRSGQSFHTKA